jgi:hypothetical protein
MKPIRILVAFAVLSAPSAGEPVRKGADALGAIAFLASPVRGDSQSVYIYRHGKLIKGAELPPGVGRLSRTYGPFVVFSTSEQDKSVIYALNARTQRFEKRASIGVVGGSSALVVSPAGDRVVAIEDGPLGDLIAVDGIVLDATHEVIREADGFRPMSWNCPGDGLTLVHTAKGRIATLDLDSKKMTPDFDLSADEGIIDSVQFSCDKSVAIVGTRRGGARRLLLYRSGKGVEIFLEGPALGDFALSSDGKTLLYANDERHAIIAQEVGGRELAVIAVKDARLSSPVLMEAW